MADSALIVGSEGFVGPILWRLLAAAGYEVRGCDLSVPPGTEGRMACNITDAKAVRELFEWAGQVALLFHLAAVDFVPAAHQDPGRVMTVNLIGTVNLIRAMKQRAPRARLVYIGSAECYGAPTSLPVTESASLEPITPYAISKTAADQYCRFASETSGLDIVRLRPFNHSGPGQSARYLLPSIGRQLAAMEAGTQERVLHVGNLDSVRDYTHAEDVARAYLAAALRGQPGNAYNVCSGVSRRVRDVVEAFQGTVPFVVAVHQDAARMRTVDVPALYGSYERLASETGWQPEIGFETLVEEVVTYWRKKTLA